MSPQNKEALPYRRFDQDGITAEEIGDDGLPAISQESKPDGEECSHLKPVACKVVGEQLFVVSLE